MKWWQSVAVVMLVWGNAVFATTGGNAEAENASKLTQIQTIKEGLAHFNLNWPGLKVKVKALKDALRTPQSRQNLINELQALDGYMHGDYVLPVNSLKDIACGRPVCDGGDGGKCHMCNVDDQRQEKAL